MTHKENIHKILKGCGCITNNEESLSLPCNSCERGLSEYLKALNYDYNDFIHMRSILDMIKDCKEAIELGEKA